MHIIHNYLQHLNHPKSPAETTSKKSQKHSIIGPIINRENYLISPTKYKAYQIMQTNSLGKYFAELNDNTDAKHLYPNVCFLEFIKTQKQVLIYVLNKK